MSNTNVSRGSRGRVEEKIIVKIMSYRECCQEEEEGGQAQRKKKMSASLFPEGHTLPDDPGDVLKVDRAAVD